jgi:putative spermidine/putrescine transport system ATP-binding protein
MTVADNVAYPLTVRKVNTTDRTTRVKRVLDMVQMGGMGDRFPGQLSGGQQQRIALARALVFDPQLVLMDEPLGALDKQLREHMQIELKALHRQLGLTFIYVTHDQSEALTMSDRVAVFSDGTIQQIDGVNQLYETPANRFVAGFVGDNTVLRGTVAQLSGVQCQVQLPCGTLLSGLNVNDAKNAHQVQACIRPERIVVHLNDTQPTHNCLAAVVTDVIYFGDHLRLRCTLPNQEDATVKIPLSSNAIPQAGQTAWLHLPPEHLRIYL